MLSGQNGKSTWMSKTIPTGISPISSGSSQGTVSRGLLRIMTLF
jgi:hypothetical protein